MSRYGLLCSGMLGFGLCLGSGASAAQTTADVGSDANPVVIHHLSESFAIDGNPGKWSAIPAVPAPFSRKLTGMLKLAWDEQGLYGLAQIKNDKISVDAMSPWTRDCLELWLETDCARSYEMSDHSYQIAFAANPDAGPGKSIVVAANGHLAAEKLSSSWKPMDGGYLIEFFIPATEVRLAMKDGTKIGMNYSVDDKGIAVEEFYTDKDMDSGFFSPCRWGTLLLKP